MRLFLNNSAEYLQNLASSISKDPASLETWRCVHVPHHEASPSDWAQNQLQRLAGKHPNCDCDAVLCDDNDILFIGCKPSDDEFLQFGYEVEYRLPSQRAITTSFYDLRRDWPKIRSLLVSKCRQASGAGAKIEGQHNFGEVSSLQENFLETAAIRKFRQPLYILLVEDDPVTQKAVSNCFKNDYAVITASDAQEGVMNYLLYAPDIVLLDIGLPDTNGLHALRQIIKCDSEAFVVMFSGNGYLDNIVAALSNGASGFITKPFRKEKLRHYILESAQHHQKSSA